MGMMALAHLLHLRTLQGVTNPSSPWSNLDIKRRTWSATRGARLSNSSAVVACTAHQDAVVAERVLQAIIGGEKEVSPYYLGWQEAQSNAYDELTNPGGCIQLGLSENKLSLDLLEQWFSTHDTAPPPGLEDVLSFKAIAGYPDVYHGLSVFRSLLASFMDDVFGGGVLFDADNMVVTTGATAAIEILAFCLADSGDVFLIPSPYYPGFDRDINFRSQVSIVEVPCSGESNFLVTRKALEQAYKDTQKNGKKVRAVLMTSPSNPLGVTYDADHLLLILEFIREKDLHLICDEIYAGSVFGSKFVSVAELVAPVDCNRVHIVFGISKILGLPGFRVGLLYSWNQQVLEAARKLTRFSSVPTHTQQVLVSLLSDKKFLGSYISENQRRLRERWRVVRHVLQEAGLDLIECTSGLFCWISLRNVLRIKTKEDELEAWRKLLYEIGVNITPGSACRCNEPGWFRLCFAFVNDQTIMVALDRLRQFALHASVEQVRQESGKFQ